MYCTLYIHVQLVGINAAQIHRVVGYIHVHVCNVMFFVFSTVHVLYCTCTCTSHLSCLWLYIFACTVQYTALMCPHPSRTLRPWWSTSWWSRWPAGRTPPFPSPWTRSASSSATSSQIYPAMATLNCPATGLPFDWSLPSPCATPRRW